MASAQLPVQINTQILSKPNLSVYYPVVTGLSNPAAQQRINAAIVALVNQLISQQGYPQNPQTQVMGWYEIKTNERGILSLSIGNYAYPPMAAHGMTYIKSLTFDIQTGHAYSLADLFKPGSDYGKVLSGLIQKQITQRNIPLLNGFKGIRPDQDFYIADKALVVYFQLYEITPYYVGLPMFPISVFELQNILAENGPLAIMATND